MRFHSVLPIREEKRFSFLLTFECCDNYDYERNIDLITLF